MATAEKPSESLKNKSSLLAATIVSSSFAVPLFARTRRTAETGAVFVAEEVHKLTIRDLGVCEYPRALALQEDAVARRKEGEIGDTLFLVEHPPSYTLGRNADESNITASAGELAEMGITVYPTGRGGQVTYHGPGQLVGYPIMDLGRRQQGPVWYVTQLEEVLIRTLADFGVNGVRDSVNRGVWVGENKIAAIGVRITRRITMHGFSLNVCVNLDDYRGIIPCGIQNRGVTSLDRLVSSVTVPQVKKLLIETFCREFEYDECANG